MANIIVFHIFAICNTYDTDVIAGSLIVTITAVSIESIEFDLLTGFWDRPQPPEFSCTEY
jgi:hypothetical protein